MNSFPNDPSCPSVGGLVGRSVDRSVIIKRREITPPCTLEHLILRWHKESIFLIPPKRCCRSVVGLKLNILAAAVDGSGIGSIGEEDIGGRRQCRRHQCRHFSPFQNPVTGFTSEHTVILMRTPRTDCQTAEIDLRRERLLSDMLLRAIIICLII